ncbi:MAG: hypothetical protein WCO06_00125 [Candidatus Roizmanbacteria bacterium]
MIIPLIILGIFVFSFLMAWRSMSDFGVPEEITKIIQKKKMKGSIIFFRDKVKHYTNRS